MGEVSARILRAFMGAKLPVLVLVAALTFWASFLYARRSSAQFGETAQIDREIPATISLDPTAAGTEIQVTDRIVTQSMDELLRQSAGTRVVQTGPVGRPFCLRLRGAPCDQTTVLLGDVPLSNPDTGDFDLSLIPLEAIEKIEVMRGGAPAWLNQGAIGGVLRLIPRSYETNEVGARITGGSFGTWRANAFGGGGSEKTELFATAGAAGSEGDYPFFDDGGTRFNPGDDVEGRRRNADFLEGFGFGNFTAQTSDKSHLRLVFLGVGRDRGEPGPGGNPAFQARTRTTRLLGSLSWTQEDDGKRPYRLQLLTNYDYTRSRFDEPAPEIGTGGPQLTDDRNHSVFARVASAMELTPWFELTTVASGRYFRRNPQELLSGRSEESSERSTVSGTVETRFHGKVGNVLLELRPSVLLTWVRAATRADDAVQPQSRESTDFLPTYRVGAAIAPVEWLAFRGSVSGGFRLPDVVQLFGNRGTILANPELVPEQSLGYDAAVTARGQRGVLRGYASVGFFSNNVEDLIRFRRTSQFTLIAENIDSARIRGIEAEVNAGITQHFQLTAELTWTQARDDEFDNQLPGQPELSAFVRPELHSGRLSRAISDLLLFFELNHIGESFADPANLVVIRARTVSSVGVGALLLDGRLGFGFRADDLFDIRGQDLLGFPLPGRRFSGRISYRQTW